MSAMDEVLARVEEHLSRRPEERPWVDGLRRTPPPPLLLDPLPEDEPVAAPAPALRPVAAPDERRSGGWLTWTPLAAAAQTAPQADTLFMP